MSSQKLIPDEETERESLWQNKMDELYSYLDHEEINVVKVNNFVANNESILDKRFKKYRGKNIAQIACSNLAKRMSKEQNVSVLRKLFTVQNVFYSNGEENCMELVHYATLSGEVEVLRSVIQAIQEYQEYPSNYKYINAVTNKCETALCLVLKKKNPLKVIECIRLLLEAEINVDSSDINNCTPILLAFGKYESYLRHKVSPKYVVEIIELLAKAGCDLDSHKLENKTARMYFDKHKRRFRNIVLPPKREDPQQNIEHVFGLLKENREYEFLNYPDLKNYVNRSEGPMTLLQLACRKGNETCVESLLKLGAKANQMTTKNDLPITIAANKGYFEIVSKILAVHKEIPTNLVLDIAKNLHRTTDAKSNYEKCLEILLQEKKLKDSGVNKSDKNGTTALHCATRLGKPKSTLRLLIAGACLSAKDKDGVMPLEDIDIGTLERYFNYCIYYKNQRLYNNPWLTEEEKKSDKVIEINYKNILPEEQEKSTTSHVEVIKSLSKTPELVSILKHPLVSSFLYLRWHKIRYFHYVNIALFAFYCILLYTHIFACYLSNSNSNTLYVVLSALLCMTTISLTLREVMQLLCDPESYVCNWENLMELVLFCITFAIAFKSPSDLESRKQLAAFAILLSAYELVLSLGQLPDYAINVQMLKTVTWNFLRFIAWYSTLLLGFTLSFYILFNKETKSGGDELNFYQNLSLSVVKTVVMLTGEFDAGSMEFHLYPFASILIFLTFVFMISIVVFNLLNGLAITDIQEIKEESDIIANLSRLRYILMIESLYKQFFSKTSTSRFSLQNDFLKDHVFSTSKFFNKGAVYITKEGYILSLKTENLEKNKKEIVSDSETEDDINLKTITVDKTNNKPKKVLDWENLSTRLDEITFNKIKHLVEVTKVEGKYSDEQEIIGKQKRLEAKQLEVLKQQTNLHHQLNGLRDEITSLRNLMEKNTMEQQQQQATLLDYLRGLHEDVNSLRTLLKKDNDDDAID